MAGTYCVNLTNPIGVGSYNTTTVSNDGAVFGETIQNNTQISWLLTNYGEAAATVDQQNGLQAAIWRTEYGSNFQIDGVDNATAGNTADMMSYYSSCMAAVVGQSAPVSNLLWISPASSTTTPAVHYQGLIGVRAAANVSAAPEPGSIALTGVGVVGMVGMITRHKAVKTKGFARRA